MCSQWETEAPGTVWPELNPMRCWESRETGYMFLPVTLRHTQLENICISVATQSPGELTVEPVARLRRMWLISKDGGGWRGVIRTLNTLSQYNQYVDSLGRGSDLRILVKENVLGSRGALLG